MQNFNATQLCGYKGLGAYEVSLVCDNGNWEHPFQTTFSGLNGCAKYIIASLKPLQECQIYT